MGTLWFGLFVFAAAEETEEKDATWRRWPEKIQLEQTENSGFYLKLWSNPREKIR